MTTPHDAAEPPTPDAPQERVAAAVSTENNWHLLAIHRDTAVAAMDRKFGRRAENEDIVHEAMLRCVSLMSIDPAGAPGLLITASYRIAIDWHRRRAREARANARSYIPATPSADEIAVDRDLARRLRHLLATLSRREQLAVIGRAQGFAPRETAELAGVPAKSVHLALGRARAILKNAARGAGAVAILPWRGRGSRRVSSFGGAAVVTAASIMLLLPSIPGGRPPHSAGPSAKHDVFLQPTGATGLAPVQRSATPATSARPAPRHFSADAPVQPARDHTVVAVPVPDPRLGRGTIVSISQSRANESALQTLQGCLSPGGLVVSPSYVGCR